MGEIIRKLKTHNGVTWTYFNDGIHEYEIEGDWFEKDIPKFFSGEDLIHSTDYTEYCNEATARVMMERYFTDKENEFLDDIIRRFNNGERNYN